MWHVILFGDFLSISTVMERNCLTQRSRLLINKTTDQTNDSTLCIQSISSWGLRRGWVGAQGGLMDVTVSKLSISFLRLSIYLRRTLYKMYWNSTAKIPGIFDFLYHMILVYVLFLNHSWILRSFWLVMHDRIVEFPPSFSYEIRKWKN